MKPTIIEKDLKCLVRKARRLGNSGHEVCGILIDNGHYIDLLEVKNRARSLGRFVINHRQLDLIEVSAKALKYKVAGTFHSHPASCAKPGESDILGADNGSLMLIIDCIGNEAKLWRIKDNKARLVKFNLMGP